MAIRSILCSRTSLWFTVGGPSIRSAMPTRATVLAATWSCVEPLDTPPKRDAFVRKLRLAESLTSKSAFTKHIKENYPSLNYSQIMQAFSKVVIAEQQMLMTLDCPPERDAFVRKLRLEKILTSKSAFKKHITEKYPSLNLCQIMEAFSKVDIAEQQMLLTFYQEQPRQEEAENHHLARSASAFF